MITRTLGLIALLAAALMQPALAEQPKFQVDPMWGVPLPNNWIFGQTGGIFVDAQDHVWLNQRPGTLTDREKRGTNKSINVKCCVPAPSVIEFDQNGKRPGSQILPGLSRCPFLANDTAQLPGPRQVSYESGEATSRAGSSAEDSSADARWCRTWRLSGST